MSDNTYLGKASEFQGNGSFRFGVLSHSLGRRSETSLSTNRVESYLGKTRRRGKILPPPQSLLRVKGLHTVEINWIHPILHRTDRIISRKKFTNVNNLLYSLLWPKERNLTSLLRKRETYVISAVLAICHEYSVLSVFSNFPHFFLMTYP